MGQYHSPYMAMGNDSVNSIDKDWAISEGNDWEPKMGEDGSILLYRQEGDNLKTLMEYFGEGANLIEVYELYQSMVNSEYLNLSLAGEIYPSLSNFSAMNLLCKMEIILSIVIKKPLP